MKGATLLHLLLLLAACAEPPRPSPPPLEAPPAPDAGAPDAAGGLVDTTQPAPEIDAVRPTRVPSVGGTEIVISGRLFQRDARVLIAGVEAPRIGGSETELRVSAPALPGRIGRVSVTVRNPGGNLRTVSDWLSYYPSSLAFAPQIKLQGGGASPIFARAADVDGDGWRDLIVANLRSDDFSVLLNRTPAGGALTFAAPQRYATGQVRPHGLALGRVNDDQLIDVLVANNGSSTVTLHAGRPNGRFADPVVVATTGLPPIYLELGDLDGDGRLDLLLTEQGQGSGVAVHRGAGAGAFQGEQFHGSPDEWRACQGRLHDLDRDGSLDVLVGHSGAGQLRLWRGKGDGTLGYLTDLPVPRYAYSPAAADLDGDGDLDLAVAGHDSNTISIFDSAGGFAFPARAEYQTGVCARDLLIDDLNGDGWPDVLNSNYCDGAAAEHNSVSIFPGRGTLRYDSHILVATGVNPWGLEVADLNNDGKKDIVVVNHDAINASGGSISVILNISQ